MTTQSESHQHREIKLALAESFRLKGWLVKKVDGEDEQTDSVSNEHGVGDGEDKRPDIDAKDQAKSRIIRGEAKVNNGDFDSEHSVTQYKLFSNRYLNGIASLLILGVPDGSKQEMLEVLNRELSENQINNIAVWEY